MQSVLKLIEKQQNGTTIKQSHIKTVVDSFMSLSWDELDGLKVILNIYKEFFKKPFLKATSQYYNNKLKKFLAENSVIDYIKKAEAHLDEEKDRVQLYLPNGIMSPLMYTCEEALISNHSQIL